MTLHVPFEQFAQTVQRVLGHREAYLAPHPAGSLVTSARLDRQALVVCVAKVSVEAAREVLEGAGFEAREGHWSLDGSPEPAGGAVAHAFIAAVAYSSGDDRPGLWLDAFPTLPTEMHVLRTMYDEFRQTGEVEDVSFEEFVRLAKPNVLVVSPTELQSYLTDKEEC